MKKIRPVVSVSFAVSLGAVVVFGAVVASCLSFSSPPDNAGGAGGSGEPGSGGSTGTTDTGGSTGTTGSGGSTGTTGAGGSTGTTGSGGSTGTTGSGGSTGTTGAGGTAGRAATGGSTGTTGTGGATGAGGAIANAGPCDVFTAAGNACGAAHSTVRALFASYTGPLYQVCRGAFVAGPNSCPSGATKDIGVVAGGYADAASQDTFCAGSSCTISIIYDQSPNGNHLHPAPSGTNGGTDSPVSATALPTTINGHAVYGVYIRKTTGYRAGCTNCAITKSKGIATGDEAQTVYMVTSQNGTVDGCCFDYGNAEVGSNDAGNGTMEAVYFGGGVVWDSGSLGGHSNAVPWVMADLENGLFAGWNTTGVQNNAQTIPTNTALNFNFVTALIIGDTAAQNAGKGRFAIYGGDATTGVLKTMYDGIRPALGGYVPMKKPGSIILGTGGDNSNTSEGQWFEGVMASGAATAATVAAIQANIVAARYGK